MNKFNWTPPQEDAICERNNTLLVSASAGSGKTTVMIERIASMIKNEEASVDNILVLTFTKASAADMRVKLRKRLEELKVSPANINSLSTAAIGTFHKFCGNLVRTYFNIANVDPAFEIMEELECAFIKGEVLDEVIAQNYDTCSLAIESFSVNRKTAALKELVISISNFLATRADDWLENTACNAYDPDFTKNVAMKKIIDHYNKAGGYFLKKFEAYKITATAEKAVGLLPYLEQCIKTAQYMCKVTCYQDMHELAGFPPLEPLMKGVGKVEKSCTDYQDFKEFKTKFKAVLDKVADHYQFTELQMKHNQKHDREIVEQIIKLVGDFDAEYSNVKLSDNKLDFNDLERYANRVLENLDIADAVRQKYKYIFIDEYQDTNPVQENILSLIGGSKNIFMVGDIKQSIYGFRGCEAAIFANKMTDFCNNLSGKVVKLNENFRSNPKILEFVNQVFGRIMNNGVAEIDYNTTSKFNTVKPYVQELGKPPVVDIILVDTKRDKQADELIKPYDITIDGCNDEELKAVTAQAAIIANKIVSMCGQKIWDVKQKRFREACLRDIVVLARSKNHFDVLLDIFKKAGINAEVYAEQKVSELFEINILNNMLFSVSNFYNDVPLVLTMQSFVFGFTPNDLTEIKLANLAAENFYKAIITYIETNVNDLSNRLQSFILFLNKYNAISKTNTVTDILTMFLTEYKIFEKLLILPAGRTYTSNIYNFLNKVRTYTVSRYLYLLENDLIGISIGASARVGDAVQIMTMHSSKGLEFPIVIIFDAGSKFSTDDIRKMMVIDKACGLCVYSTDADEFTKTVSIARLGALISANSTQIAEEQRLFYVALTRAKNHLIIVGAYPLHNLKAGCEDYEILESKNYLQFLAPTVLGPVPPCDFSLTVISIQDIDLVTKRENPRVLTGAHDEKLVKEFQEIFDKIYHYERSTQVILKNSVSSLTKREQQVIDHKPKMLNSHIDRGADYGTQFHKLMSRAASDIRDVNVIKCNAILDHLLAGYKVYKELPFLQNLNNQGENILIQGVIDLLAVKNGHAILIDYKTTNAPEKKLVELYYSQLSMYATAVKQAINPASMDVYIYSTMLSKLIKLNLKK